MKEKNDLYSALCTNDRMLYFYITHFHTTIMLFILLGLRTYSADSETAFPHFPHHIASLI